MHKKPFGRAQRIVEPAKPFGRAQPIVEPASAPPQPAVHPPLSDLRQSKRKRTLLAGKLCYGAGLSADCTISDLSDGGAKVRSDAADIVPTEVYLVHLRDQKAYEATVAWRRTNGTLGLKLNAVHDLENPQTEELKLLRLHCVEHEPRTSVLD